MNLKKILAAFAAHKGERQFRAELAPVLALRLAAAERRDRLRRLKQAQELGIIWRMLLGVTDGSGRVTTVVAYQSLHG